jgi:predicted RNase H-like HicB family nuclease
VDFKFDAEVKWSAQDGMWVATAPQIPGCSALGSSRAAAILELEDAAEAWESAQTHAGNRHLFPAVFDPA